MSARHKHTHTESHGGGMPLWARFTLTMSLALAASLAAVGYFAYQSANKLVTSLQDQALAEAAQLGAEATREQADLARLPAEKAIYQELERQIDMDLRMTAGTDPTVREALKQYQTKLRDQLKSAREKREHDYAALAKAKFWDTTDNLPTAIGASGVKKFAIWYGPQQQKGVVYKFQPEGHAQPYYLLRPEVLWSSSDLLGWIVGGTLAVVVIGALVAAWAAQQVTGPLVQLVHDVRQISTGDLAHRVHARGSAETAALGRALDKMVHSLAEARGNAVELEVREREVAVAAEVREQLLPQATPRVAGYEIGQAFLGAGVLGGDFHDFIEIGQNGRAGVGLLVGEVSGKGLPCALVGATARSYLRAKLSEGGDVKLAMQAVNKQLARDVRRGMAVTSLYAFVDPAQGVATVACTGHKVPLIRYTASDRKVRLIHPEGIALGFDKGPVFDGKLEIAKVPVEPGDRLVLVNTGAVSVADAEGRELGEKALYAQVMRLGGLSTEAFIAGLRAAIEEHAGAAGLARDVSIVTISRD